jgi:hypothetical protein
LRLGIVARDEFVRTTEYESHEARYESTNSNTRKSKRTRALINRQQSDGANLEQKSGAQSDAKTNAIGKVSCDHRTARSA